MLLLGVFGVSKPARVALDQSTDDICVSRVSLKVCLPDRNGQLLCDADSPGYLLCAFPQQSVLHTANVGCCTFTENLWLSTNDTAAHNHTCMLGPIFPGNLAAIQGLDLLAAAAKNPRQNVTVSRSLLQSDVQPASKRDKVCDIYSFDNMWRQAVLENKIVDCPLTRQLQTMAIAAFQQQTGNGSC